MDSMHFSDSKLIQFLDAHERHCILDVCFFLLSVKIWKLFLEDTVYFSELFISAFCPAFADFLGYKTYVPSRGRDVWNVSQILD